MIVWGDNSIGSYYGYGNDGRIPKEVKQSNVKGVKVLAAGDASCCMLHADGSVHTFGKLGDRSLGHDSTTTKVDAFDTVNIVDVFAGGSHMFAKSDKGQVYGWGKNHSCQLGWVDVSNNVNNVTVPKSVKFLNSRRVLQISCGKCHSLMLLQDGSIYSMGDNKYGQLGIGSFSNTPQPSEVPTLQGLPIWQIVAGGWHSFCVTLSGRVFCWGRNDFGQLGLGDKANRPTPNSLRMLRSQAVSHIAAGDYHTVALTKDGGVFTFGSSAQGQLGHGNISEAEVNPRKVFELMGSVVTQVVCGRSHTLAFVPDTGYVFAFGSGISGQLGQGKSVDHLPIPTIVRGPWRKRKADTVNDKPFPLVKQISAGGDQSYVVLCSENDTDAPDFRETESRHRMWTLNRSFCERISRLRDGEIVTVDITTKLECIMSSISCLNASFLATDHHETSVKYHGISLMEARVLFSSIMQCGNRALLKRAVSLLGHNLETSLSANPPDIEALRLYIFLPEFPVFHNQEYYDDVLFHFVARLLALSEKPAKILDQWYSSLDTDYFTIHIAMCQRCISSVVQKASPTGEANSKVFLLLELLKKLNNVNNRLDVAIVDFRKFYIPDLNDNTLLEVDYQRWARNKGNDFCYCKYPFVFNSKAKTTLLQIDAKFQMHQAFMHARGRNVAAFLGLDAEIDSPVLELEIRRDQLVGDAIRRIGDAHNLKRPLIVKFLGEEGQDAGGVRKEFFMLILRDVLNPKYGMFRHYQESNLLWFTDYEIETQEMYHLIGTLCGLAIYNSTIIDINFPLALYKKLLGGRPTLNDMKELDPPLGNGLQQLLDFVEEGTDTIEETFGMTFSVARELFGEISYVDLIENGSEVSVTIENRSQYVAAYLNYIFNESIKSQFNAFSEGFHRVCGGEMMNLFRPEELMEMVVGNQHYNWEDLEKKTRYKGEYFPNHRVIRWFWDVFHAFSLEDKKEFVRFLTGSSKIPINGLEILIQPAPRNDDYLPVAHTCFNVLDLPRYSSKEILEAKLTMAIRSEGFHLA